MTSRVSASDLYRIDRASLLDAFERMARGEAPPRFVDSTRFDVVFQRKRYPPKQVVALAAERVLGSLLGPDDFSGGESSAAFRLLLERGFEIVTKELRVGSFDATFSVGENEAGRFVVIESKGPNRNADYLAGLESLLLGLADLGAQLEGVSLDSRSTTELPASERRLRPTGRTFPIDLRGVADLNELRREITASAAQTGRSPDATRGGNPTKRLRLDLRLPHELSLYDLGSRLSVSVTSTAEASRTFQFVANAPAHAEGSTTRRAMDSAVVEFAHARMQASLYSQLVAEHGAANVSAELVMLSGRPADLVVRTPAGLILFEIKTSLVPHFCVRQALGQLLEYGCWPGSPDLAALVVVGPRPIDQSTTDFLEGLRSRFALPLEYRHQPEDSSG